MPFEFSFTDEQEKYDKLEEFPSENVSKMAEQGYFGLTVPEKYGGKGLSKINYGILLEELGAICASHGTILGAHLGLCITPIILFGTLSCIW